MSVITVDFETYWSADYTLSKMTTESYVRHPDFAVHMVGVKVGDNPTNVYTHAQFTTLAARIPWGDHAILCQNTAFDGLILSHHYGVRPKLWLDTMSMFRAVYPALRASLKVIAETLGLQAKGGASGYDIVNTKGKRGLLPHEWTACAEYCRLDVDIAWQAFQLLKPHLPPMEFRLIDQTIRFFTEPVLSLLSTPLNAEIDAEQERKAELLSRCATDKELLSSGPKFAALLETYGVTPPLKPSPAALKKDPSLRAKLERLNANEMRQADYEANAIPWTYAFGKGDSAMKALLQHDNPGVQALAAARLGVKSTIAETRAATLLDACVRGPFPVQLNYCAAVTSRWGGAGSVNVQNLTKGSRLREAFAAPAGHKLVVCDLSAIEARVNAYLAGQTDTVEVFRAGGDIYCDMATAIYHRPITKADKAERQIGKVLILSCGYGMSALKFAENQYLAAGNLFGAEMAGKLGTDVVYHYSTRYGAKALRRKPLTLTPSEWLIHCAVSQHLVDAYREKNSRIVDFWRRGDAALAAMYEGETIHADAAGVTWTTKNTLHFPVGNPVRYTDLKRTVEGRKVQYSRASREGRSHLHGALIVENIVQAASRHILAQQALKLQDEGLRIAFTCHDEIVGVSPDGDAEAWSARMVEVMSETPAWMPGLPLAAEASVGRTYGEAK